MTKKAPVLILFFLIAYSANFSLAQEAIKKAPAGMKQIENKGVTRRTPQDTQVRKEGGVTIVEGFRQYVSRKIQEIEARLTRSEARQEELTKEVEQLKGALDDLKNDNLRQTEQLKKEINVLQKKQATPPVNSSR